MRSALILALAGLWSLAAPCGHNAARAQGPSGRPALNFPSPEVKAEKTVTFRIHAPEAKAVRLSGGDIPDLGPGKEMTKSDERVWEVTVGPLPPGAYRYQFNVDGVSVTDPRNTSTSESNSNVWSLCYVPGSETSDLKEVPHGSISQVLYHSKSLGKVRRAHVYTPPGYESGTDKYPVFYLLHGAFDSDASWSTVGRAGFILDNLIASGKARPMIVVMPAGHTGPFRFGPPGDGGFDRQMNAFENDFKTDLRPFVESSYRTIADRDHRAIAGLSMGGAQTLNLAFADLEDYGYVGVFSSGIFGIAGGFGGGGGGNAAPNQRWEDDHRSVLDDSEVKKDLRLLWFGCGSQDFLLKTSDATVEMLKSHGFDVAYHQTDGGHTWLNWRDYLAVFTPKLFADH
jgi:enterochelin esterase family protein